MHPEVAHALGYSAGLYRRPPSPPPDPDLAAIYLAAYAIGARRAPPPTHEEP